MSPDYYELHLLGLAMEACDGLGLQLVTGEDFGREDFFYAGTVSYEGDINGFTELTLTEALAALLDDLGVEYPERPSAERASEELLDITASHDSDFSAHREHAVELLQLLYAREPLTVLALLGGGR